MLDAAATFFRRLAQSVRVADVLDVLLVAAFLYAFLTWMRRDTRPGTTWRLAVVGVFFGAVYLLAEAFSMFLVEQLLGALFIAFLVASVVLFQAEIRRMIDRVGSLSFLTPAAGSRDHQTVDLITEAAGHFAKHHTGALMAVRGRDSWEGVTQGGLELDGRLSLPLLESIFHEDTDGHDGAVLIENDRAVRFGTHLPLAVDLPESSRAGGTRHTAALGLAEQSDAFVIVVSEEHGTISVAEGGRLTEMDSIGALRERLGRFWKTHYSSEAQKQRWWSRANVQTACLSLLLACLLWLTFAYEPGSTQRTMTVPVAFRNVEPDWMIGEPQPAEVTVTLSGSERAFRLVEPSELSVSFPLSELKEGANQLLISQRNLDLPGGLELQTARPPNVNVMARRLRSVRLPVRAQSNSPLPDSLRLRTDPDSVDLMVPRKGDVPVPEDIRVEAVTLDSLRAAEGAVQAKLLTPEDTRLPEKTSRSVQVRLEAVPTP
ncbi:MAG: hypothetical protein BRD44_07255 [Bacteroidetes bacterium QS_7_67_15]|nr:MAG: hypothetical protein BRD44_07255 [Bacteroidetes bacterium QS_7_67_15]